MLARTVENVYWLARYLERAENTARLISVNTHLLLDLPVGIAPGWLPLVDITGNRVLFDSAYRGTEERDVVQFLIADRANPGSIVTSLEMARENARTLRDVLPAEAWEELNRFFMGFSEELPSGLSRRTRFDFLKRSVLMSQTLTGMLEGTMSRNEAHTFMLLGRNLERADMSSRIIDVRSAQLLPADVPELRPFDAIQWMSVLRSLSGYEMYRLGRRTRVNRADVLEFVLRDEQFPRACLLCLRQMELCLHGLPHSAGARSALALTCGFLAAADLGALDQPGLHELIDKVQLHITAVHDEIAGTYFPREDRPMTQRQSQFTPDAAPAAAPATALRAEPSPSRGRQS
ncbi:MAG TPA: alpha-E domain-containing protein [Steroidobacteraceae bacterium]|nr:alpha-E domain-containing protein [Steroidobacteraceae bacterium]